MSDMTWDYDICLSCDNHSRNGDKYCSQACRLADMERGVYSSEPSTPALFAANKSPAIDSHRIHTPYDFNPDRHEAPLASPRAHASTYQTYSAHPSSYSVSPAASHVQPSTRGLSTSSSRSSLTSVSSSRSSTAMPGLSQDIIDQLRVYTGAFDRTRDWKRRGTMS